MTMCADVRSVAVPSFVVLALSACSPFPPTPPPTVTVVALTSRERAAIGCYEVAVGSGGPDTIVLDSFAVRPTLTTHLTPRLDHYGPILDVAGGSLRGRWYVDSATDSLHLEWHLHVDSGMNMDFAIYPDSLLGHADLPWGGRQPAWAYRLSGCPRAQNRG